MLLNQGSASADGLCCGREGRVCQGRSEAVEISDECEWCDGLGKILFKGVFVNLTDRAELCSYRLDGRFGNVKLT